MRIELRAFGRSVEFHTKAQQLNALAAAGNGGGGWWPWIRESFTGAWQQNVDIRPDTLLTYSAVFACVTLIASDIAKLGLRLVAQDEDGIWTETESAAFSPVLRKPNRYSTRIKFIEQWMTSKLIHGNTYVLKERDARGVVVALYVLDPTRVTVLVAPDGSVYYELKRDDLAGQSQETVIVPAREIIHDKCVALYHPLVGVSPLTACAAAATQGLSIQNNSERFFSNGSQPSGLIIAPAGITQGQADEVEAKWTAKFSGANFGKVGVIAGDSKYVPLGVTAVDSQLIEQLNWTGVNICTCYHVQPYMISIGQPPPYANVEPLLQQYYAQCLQSHIENLELVLDEGLELPKPYGTEFDLDDLLRMDTATKTAAAAAAIGSGGMSPDEARRKYFDLGPVKGGDTPYMQQQMYALKALAERDADSPFAKPTPAAAPALPPAPPDEPAVDMAASFGDVLQQKALALSHRIRERRRDAA